MKKKGRRTKRAIAIDRAKKAKKVVKSRSRYTDPRRMDLAGYDTPKKRKKRN